MAKKDEIGWKEFDNIREFNNTITFLGARIEKSRRPQGIGPKVNLKPGALGNISPAYPVVMTNGPHGLPGRDVCPFRGSTSKASLSPESLPGYTGWYRPHSPLLNWYRPIHFGPRPSKNTAPATTRPKYFVPRSKNGKLQFREVKTSAVLRHEISTPSNEGRLTYPPWTTVMLCPFLECQGNGRDIPGVQTQFYARAYGPSILAGRVAKVPIHYYSIHYPDKVVSHEASLNESTVVGYEIAFHFLYPGTYTVEVVMEQGDAWHLSQYPRSNSELSDPDPAYEGWMLPGFPKQVEVVEVPHDDGVENDDMQNAGNGVEHSRSWCNMDQLEESHPADQWLVTGTKDTALNEPNQMGSFEQYQMGYTTIGVCTDFVKSECSILPTKHLLWNPTTNEEKEKGNILSQCIRNRATKVGNITAPTRLNIILIGDSVVRYNTNRLTELLKINLDPNTEVYVTYVAELYSGVLYGIPSIKKKLLEVATRDEQRVVIFNFGLHDVYDTCVEHSVESMTTDEIPRVSGDCVDFFRRGFNELMDFIEEYPADLKIFRSTNAGWMRWGQFGFVWLATNSELAIYSHHAVGLLNTVAIETIQERRRNATSSVKILDYYWPTLARPDHTDVDRAQGQSAGSHLVHPGIDTMRVLVRLEVMMILRHFCSDFLDQLAN